MEELLDEVDRILKIIKANVERNKKYHDYPFTQNCDHYYKLILLQNSLDVWTQCKSLIEKYRKTRMGPLMPRRSNDFKRVLETQKKVMPGFITRATEVEILEYIRKLEWIVEELEAQLYKFSKWHENITN